MPRHPTYDSDRVRSNWNEKKEKSADAVEFQLVLLRTGSGRGKQGESAVRTPKLSRLATPLTFLNTRAMSTLGNSPGMHLQDLILDTRVKASREQKSDCVSHHNRAQFSSATPLGTPTRCHLPSSSRFFGPVRPTSRHS